jgi:hypothetical protein
MNTQKENLRALVKGLYDLQKLRIQVGNRVVANKKVKMGQAPGTKETEMDKEAKEYLAMIRKHFKLITDGMLTIPTEKKFHKDGVFDDYSEAFLAGAYTRHYENEQMQIKRLEDLLSGFPIWTEFLDDVRGCGPLMAGVIIAELDPYKAKYPSSFHKYCGLDVVNGKGRSRHKECLVDQEYTDKDGNIQTKKGISFNPFAKTKIVGVLGSSFIKQPAEKCKYRKIYDDYKHRLENHPDHVEKTKGHRHAMAN